MKICCINEVEKENELIRNEKQGTCSVIHILTEVPKTVKLRE